MSSTPVLYLGHGAPPLADDPIWTAQLAQWSAALPRPESILMVSAHWQTRPISLSSTTGAPLLHDFWGFPQKYYEVTYPSPPAPGVAGATERLLREGGLSVRREESRGLDHGAYVPLVQMYPAADIPVVQLSLPTLDPAELVEVGRRLAPLREEGVMVIGSGFTTHNMGWLRPSTDPYAGPVPAASVDFDAWAAQAMADGDLDALVDVAHRARSFRHAHPRTEHWAPIYLALGVAASRGSLASRAVIDGFWYGFAKRSWQLD